ncbi:MAG: DinB family protein [Pricia sp.]
MNTTEAQMQKTPQVIAPTELLVHWQGHRSLTRKVIEAFPEKELFNYSIGGMRPFAGMVKELLGIAGPGIREIVTGETAELKEDFDYSNKKVSLLEAWDSTTEEINNLWPKITLERFQEHIKTFGQYEGTVQSSIFYFIDNEIHHRGQGYVYLRSLGIEPPMFWDRQGV